MKNRIIMALMFFWILAWAVFASYVKSAGNKLAPECDTTSIHYDKGNCARMTKD